MTEQADTYGMNTQAEGYPEGVTVGLVDTLTKTARLVRSNGANACKAAYALTLLRLSGIDGTVTQVIMSMGEDDEAN